MLNFGADEPEENVHTAILSLIRRGGLVPKREDQRDIAEWTLAPGILEAVGRKLREIRSRLPPPFPDRFSERFHIFGPRRQLRSRYLHENVKPSP